MKMKNDNNDTRKKNDKKIKSRNEMKQQEMDQIFTEVKYT
jgi:hypothetical protein